VYNRKYSYISSVNDDQFYNCIKSVEDLNVLYGGLFSRCTWIIAWLLPIKDGLKEWLKMKLNEYQTLARLCCGRVLIARCC